MESKAVARLSAFLSFSFCVLLLSLGLNSVARAGTIVADSGFRPAVDGFSFDNYGNDEGMANLDTAEIVRMYGREACLSPKGRCVLDPGMRSFMEYLNDEMDGGHCFGLAALSELIHAGRLPDFGFASLSAFGAGSNTFGLSQKNVLLQRSIARGWAFQVYPSVYNNIVQDTPVRVLETLQEKLSSGDRESWNISIRRRDGQGGHAITPYAIEDMGNGISHVHVYDNNWPGDSSRRIIVDRNENTWSYYAATRPDIPQAQYEGDADTKSFRLKPIDPALGVQPCPYCTGRKGAKLKRNAISLSSPSLNHSRLLLIDEKGRRSGFSGGRTINRIPGVKIVHPDTGITFAAEGSHKPILDSSEPIYMVPKNLKLKIKVIGRSDRPAGLESITVSGPTFGASIDEIRATRKKPYSVRFDPGRGSLTAEHVGVSRELSTRVGARGSNATFQIGVELEGLTGGSPIRMVRNSKARVLKLDLDQRSSAETLTASVARFDRRGRARFEVKYRLGNEARAEIRYGQMFRGGSAWLVIRKPDGSPSAKLKLKAADDD